MGYGGGEADPKRAITGNMTALIKYERLEAIGLWRENGDAQRREVIVSFGAASLVLSDKNDMPLAHWSLAAVRVVGKSGEHVIFAPDKDADETVEIDDPLMVEAIGKVRDRLTKRQSHPGRLRWVLGAVLVPAVIGFLWFGLPVLAAQYATRVTPAAKQEQIGAALMAQTNRLTGQPCDGGLARGALGRFQDWLVGDEYRIYVVDLGARFSTHLPGNRILINRILLEEYAGPEVAAGFVLMEKALATENPPLPELFSQLGTGATLGFLANGALDPEKLAEYAEGHLSAPMRRPSDQGLLALFAGAKLTSAPFAYALDSTLDSTRVLVEGDPVKQGYRPRLSDGDWIALQTICSG